MKILTNIAQACGMAALIIIISVAAAIALLVSGLIGLILHNISRYEEL